MVSYRKIFNNLLTDPVTTTYFSINPFYIKKRTNSSLSIFENSFYFSTKKKIFNYFSHGGIIIFQESQELGTYFLTILS